VLHQSVIPMAKTDDLLPIDELLDAGWSRELAWILGMVYGDGHVSTWGVTVIGGGKRGKAAQQGFQLLERWRTLVSPEARFEPRKGHEETTKTVEMYSKRFCDWLRDFGLESDKSAILTWPRALPEKFAPDFVRGLWDADGSCDVTIRRSGTKRLAMSMYLVARTLMEQLPEHIHLDIPLSLKEYVKKSGRYKGHKCWGYDIVSDRGLQLGEWLYGLAPASMRHEGKWEAYEEFRIYALQGCSECGREVYKLGLCKPHWHIRTYSDVAADHLCTKCGLRAQEAKGLCPDCYPEDLHKRRLEEGRCNKCSCGCGRIVKRYGSLSACCSSRVRRERAARGEFGPCSTPGCPRNAEVRGICRPCYDKVDYKQKRLEARAAREELAQLRGPIVIRSKAVRAATPVELETIGQVVDRYKAMEFPWMSEADVDISSAWGALLKVNVIEDAGSLLVSASPCQDVCSLFQEKNMFSCVHKATKKSLVQAFNDPFLIRRAALAKVKKAETITTASILHTLRRYIKAPSNMPPSLAKYVVDRYSPPGGVVVDPCAGFGGRMLGALAGQKKVTYVGNDASPAVIESNRALASKLSLVVGNVEGRAVLHVGAAEKWEEWPECSLVFTSPPYYNTELYNGGEQSWLTYKTYAEWREGFLSAVILKAKDRLLVGGHLALVVRDVIQGRSMYPLESDCSMLAAKHGLKFVEMLGVSYKPAVCRPEKLIVWQKV
jgi:hypothetical protein